VFINQKLKNDCFQSCQIYSLNNNRTSPDVLIVVVRANMVWSASRVRQRKQAQRGRPCNDANHAPHVQVQDSVSAKTEIGYRVAQCRRLPCFAHGRCLRSIHYIRRLPIHKNCHIQWVHQIIIFIWTSCLRECWTLNWMYVD